MVADSGPSVEPRVIEMLPCSPVCAFRQEAVARGGLPVGAAGRLRVVCGQRQGQRAHLQVRMGFAGCRAVLTRCAPSCHLSMRALRQSPATPRSRVLIAPAALPLPPFPAAPAQGAAAAACRAGAPHLPGHGAQLHPGVARGCIISAAGLRPRAWAATAGCAVGMPCASCADNGVCFLSKFVVFSLCFAASHCVCRPQTSATGCQPSRQRQQGRAPSPASLASGGARQECNIPLAPFGPHTGGGCTSSLHWKLTLSCKPEDTPYTTIMY